MSGRTGKLTRAALRRAGAAAALVMACFPCAAAAQPEDLRQYAHTSWRVRNGAPGAVRHLAQGADGVLWIGSERGLFHFDGVRFERYEPPGQAPMPHGVFVLLALPDTSLWIGHLAGGVSVIHRGRMVTHGPRNGVPPGTVVAMVRDSSGATWAATTGGLARFDGRRWKTMGPAEGYPPAGPTFPVLVDRRGAVWANTDYGFYILYPGAARFERRVAGPGAEPGAAGTLSAAPDGSVWAVDVDDGIFMVADANGRPPPPGARAWGGPGMAILMAVNPHRPALAYSAAGRLVQVWLPGTRGAPAGRPRLEETPFSRAAGMSGDVVTAALYDREGTLWVGTPTGIDRFRGTRLTPVLWPGPVQTPGILPDTGGTAWASVRNGSPAGLYRIEGRAIPRPDGAAELLVLYRDPAGGIWLGGHALWQRRGGAFVPVPLPAPPPTHPGGSRIISAMAMDRGGRLWLSVSLEGVYRRGAGGWERFGEREGLGPARVMTADGDTMWLGYRDGRLARAAGGSVRFFAAAEGPGVGGVLAVTMRGGRVWVGGADGVAVLAPRARTFAALRLDGRPLRGVSGIVEDGGGNLWLNGADGVVRVPAEEVRRALARPGAPVRHALLDHRDGIEPPAAQAAPLAAAAAGPDGRIWFTSTGGLSWVDPRRMRTNTVPPPVHLRALTAEGRRYPAGGDTLRLPPRTRSLSVAYTAYSLAVPERVRFRYRLEGLDTAWHDAGGRREAFFTNLPPGRYRFRVIAANEDGVWNTAGASLAFTIRPAWNQTWWFRALVLAALVALPAAAALAWQRRRGRRAAERTQARFDAMLAERTRVARELHDTLLGDMAGVAMQLSAGARRAETSGAGPGVVELLTSLGAQVQHAMVEARRSVTGMRASPADLPPLHERLAEVAGRTFAGTEIAARVEHAGAPRPLEPAVADEIVGIAAEAMANARKHAGCRSVTVACRYEPRALRVSVRDDGRGFDPSRGPPEGHWGLVGMRERASSVGAVLGVTSAPGAGTEVVLDLPLDEKRRRWWRRLVPPR